MNVLLLGSGGREHALALALVKSPLLSRLVMAPGNPGMASLGMVVPIDLSDHEAVLGLAREQNIDFVVIGPEAPLVAGLVDDLAAAGILAFGPDRVAAQLEGSKAYTKQLCMECVIPTASYRAFDQAQPALDYVREQGAPIVIKADGLAAGKGVTVAQSLAEAEAAIVNIFAGSFGAAGHTIVIEECLLGEEVSFFALCDGTHAVSLGSAQDHKRVGEGDTGPNTGGMGAYSPAPILTPALEAQVMERIIQPALKGMADRGAPFHGLLFAGLMIGSDGPKLIEFNTRFGDPETQVILPRLQDDLLALLIASARGELGEVQPALSAQSALTVVLAAQGYPDAPVRGGRIEGLERAAKLRGVTITHAGTALSEGTLIANGGRVLNVTGVADDLAQAQARAYAGVAAVDFPSGFCRKDIGWRALKN